MRHTYVGVDELSFGVSTRGELGGVWTSLDDFSMIASLQELSCGSEDTSCVGDLGVTLFGSCLQKNINSGHLHVVCSI